MARTVDQIARDALANQAWAICTLQAQCEKQADELAALKAELAALKAKPEPPA